MRSDARWRILRAAAVGLIGNTKRPTGRLGVPAAYNVFL